MKKKAFAAMTAALLLTGCSNPFDKNDAEEAAVTTTAPVTTTEAPEIPTATLPQKMIYLRMGDDESAEPFLTSDHITDCSMEIVPDQPDNSTYVVDIFFDDEGKEIFAQKTEEAAANGGVISIWYNDYIISRATVEAPITDGAAVISNLDMNSAAKIAGWIYECINAKDTNNSNEGEQNG